jgi:hypothetical protein
MMREAPTALFNPVRPPRLCLDWPGPHDLASWLRLEDSRLLGERIDALARLRGRLLNDDELCQSRHNEGASLFEFLVANFGNRIEDASPRNSSTQVWITLAQIGVTRTCSSAA